MSTMSRQKLKEAPPSPLRFERSLAHVLIPGSVPERPSCVTVSFLFANTDVCKMPKEGKTFPCDICDITFSRHYNLQRHLASKHPSREVIAKFICHICLKACKSEEELHIHWEIHPNPKQWLERQSALSKSAIGKRKKKRIRKFSYIKAQSIKSWLLLPCSNDKDSTT